jgi:hypothetical protein
MMHEYPWDVRRVPNYQSAPSVDVEDGERLDAATFQRRYVMQNRPCLIKNAASRWPALDRWADSDYLVSTVGDVEARASCTPKIEAFGLRSAIEERRACQMTNKALLPARTVRDWLPPLRTPDDEVLFVELGPGDERVRRLGADLAAGGERFPFLPDPPRPRFAYGDWGAMLYKNSYSDWHYHPGAEAIMCQVLGTKDVLLLPPTRQSWDQIVPVHQTQWKVWNVDVSKAPAYRNLRPCHVVVERGDGLFLPINWWHAVQARPREFGITVPVWWDSPFRDLRQPATRHLLWRLWRRRKPLAARELLASTYGTVAKVVRHQLPR